MPREGEEPDPMAELLQAKEAQEKASQGAEDEKEAAELRVLVKVEEGAKGAFEPTTSKGKRFLDPVKTLKFGKEVAEDASRHRSRMWAFDLISACIKEHHNHLVQSLVRGDICSLMLAVSHLTQHQSRRAHVAALR
jgi:hypothetical protein